MTIYGDNATGKTTIANAFAWLFTGKNAAGTAEFDPAPVDGSNGKIHNLETAVTVRFEGGSEFRRVLTEVWTKKRGEVTAQLTGTKTVYYRDGVPLKEKEFNAAVEELFGSADAFRMLSVGGYFPAVMDWKARRKLLIEMCGNIEDSDVIAANSELSELPEIIKSHSVDDYLKIAKSQKSELRKEIDLIPARITENENAASDAVLPEKIPELKSKISALEEEEKTLNSKASAVSAADLRKSKINDLRRRLEEERTDFLSKFNQALEQHNSELKALCEKRDEIFSERSPLLVKQSTLPGQIRRMKERREQLMSEHSKVRAQQYDGGETCPFCGQKLPEEKLEKAVAEFNRRKSEQLEAISAEAKRTCHKDMILELETELSEIGGKIENLTAEYDKYVALISEKQQEKPKGDFTETQVFAELSEKIRKAEAEPAENTQELEKLSDRISETAAKLEAEKEKLYKAKAAEQCRKRISELEERKKELAEAYAELEKGEYLCELFIRTKVSMLDERINSRFRTLKFKLFHEQQNGGLQEICKVLIPCESGLVEYEKANNAARINAGLEIIDVLSEHFGVRLPVFADNAESVTKLIRTGSQAIRLVVSEADKKLRAEYEA
jgi:DNA repair exonuclease SbcCD ATPase subunit